MPEGVRRLLAEQCGVISRVQALGLGVTPADLERSKRRRELVPVWPGVFVTHTGPLTFDQRIWAALLVTGPSAVAGTTALRLHQRQLLAPYGEPIELVIPDTRRVAKRDGIRVRHRHDFGDAVINLSPPRLRYEYAVVDAASQVSGVAEAMNVLSTAIGSRRTTARRLAEVVEGQAKLKNRRRLLHLLADIATGIHSVLERDYHRLVARPHALPVGRRQLRAVRDGGVVYHDLVTEWLIIELDGAHHREADQHDADLERDLDSKVAGSDTARLGYRQVHGRSCRTAAKVARLLKTRGWPDTPSACSDPGCVIAEGSVVPGATDPSQTG